MTIDILKAKAGQIRQLARSHGVVRLRIFGSRAVGQQRESSDLDLLVRLKSDRDLFDLVDFQLSLEDLLRCEVDVVSEGGLSPYLRRRILRQAKPL